MIMEWIQTLSIIATVIGSAFYIHREVQADIKMQTARTDQINARTDQLNARTDQLYQMFIDLLTKNQNPKTHP